MVEILLKSPDLSINYSYDEENELSKQLMEFLKAEYLIPLLQRIEDKAGIDLIKENFYQNVYVFRFIEKHRTLINASVITIKELVDKAQNDFELLVGHELFKIFALSPRFGFTQNNISFHSSKNGFQKGAMTYSKLFEKLRKKMKLLGLNQLQRAYSKIIGVFFDIGILRQVTEEELDNYLSEYVSKQNIPKEELANRKNLVRSFLKNEKDVAENQTGLAFNSGLITISELKEQN